MVRMVTFYAPQCNTCLTGGVIWKPCVSSHPRGDSAEIWS